MISFVGEESELDNQKKEMNSCNLDNHKQLSIDQLDTNFVQHSSSAKKSNSIQNTLMNEYLNTRNNNNNTASKELNIHSSIMDVIDNYSFNDSKWRSLFNMRKNINQLFLNKKIDNNINIDINANNQPNNNENKINDNHHHHHHYQHRNKNQSNCPGKLGYSREVKKAQKLFVIVVFFMICWIPLYTSNAIQAICSQCLTISANLMDFLIILSHINSAGSPFLYAFHMKDFRMALRRLICKGAINQRKLRDLRREELFSISGYQRGQSIVSRDKVSKTDQMKNFKKTNRMYRQKFQPDYFSSLQQISTSINENSISDYNPSKEMTICQRSTLFDPKYFTVPMRNKSTIHYQ